MVTPIVFCGQRLMVPGTGNAQLREYVCTVAEGHLSEYHMDVQAMATWRTAGDLVVHTDQRQAALRCDTRDPDPKGTAALAQQVHQRGETIAKLRSAIARTGECTCRAYVFATADGAVDGDAERDDLCPRHGTVAELARQLRWARHFTATIEAACPPEITEPFSGRDVAAWVAEQLTQVHPAEIRDLARQRNTQRERAERAEAERDGLAEARLEARGEIA